MTDLIGSSIEDLDTPTLLLDAGAMQRSLDRMAAFFADRPAKLRPHFKNHKCVTLARRQVDAGSTVGITCAKLGEAEVLADHGFSNLLVANQVVGGRKIDRLVALAGRIERLAAAVDDVSNINAIAAAARAVGATVGLLVEVDIGMGRCGVPPGEPTLELARHITEQAQVGGVRFDGIQAYEGHLVYHDDSEQKHQAVRDSMGLAVTSRRLVEADGIACGVISGGSTATHPVTGTMDGVDEIQAGTYPTMDWRYHELAPIFEIAMSVLVRVISTHADGSAAVDIGVKGAGSEFGVPKLMGHDDAEIPMFRAEEHCVIKNGPRLRVGDAVRIIPSHACTTCNLYREFVVHEDGKVVDVWPIEGSGMIQ